ncbi:MAG TPA: flavin reductase family protein [Flavobacteriales bacterium]
MITIDPKGVDQPTLHQYLLGAIAPRPIAFASTVNEEGVDNLAPFSFFNIFSSNPPIAIFSPARRGRDNTTKHTYENIKKHRECVINIVNYELAQQMSLASTEYADGVSEFVKAGLTPIDSVLVKPKRVKESPVQMECIVKDVIELGTGGGAGNLIICEIVMVHIQKSILDTDGKIAPEKIDLVARMGGSWYTRASQGLFQIKQPTKEIGIGFDQLPKDILESSILTGSELAQLAGVEQLPNETDVNEYKLLELSDLFIELEDQPSELELRLHQRAKELIADKKINEAWLTLLSFNN